MPRDNYTLLWGFLFYYRYFPRMSDIYGNNHTVINTPRMPDFSQNNTVIKKSQECHIFDKIIISKNVGFLAK